VQSAHCQQERREKKKGPLKPALLKEKELKPALLKKKKGNH